MAISHPVETPTTAPEPAPTGRERVKKGVSRRGLLGVAGIGLAGAAAGAAGGFALAREEDAPAAQPDPGRPTYPFYGERQAGIITPM
jgi:deferrochelatase/peroxidase EfeB